jgi:hypothetical protein
MILISRMFECGPIRLNDCVLVLLMLIGWGVFERQLGAVRSAVEALRSAVEDGRSAVEALGENLTKKMTDEFKAVRKEVSGSLAYKQARDTTVWLEAYNSTGYFVWGGSGTVVDVSGTSYIATARHLMVNLTDGDRFKIIFADGGWTKSRPGRHGFYNHTAADVTLIPFALPQGRTAARVVNTSLRIGKRLIGISLHNETMNGLDCHVKALDRAFGRVSVAKNHTVLTDCGGVPGFSGTGYFNTKGSLIAVHKGGEMYPHGAERVTQEGRVDELFKGLNVSCQVDPARGLLPEQCYDDLETLITLSSRNPTAAAVPAKYLFEIADGIRQGTLKLFKPPHGAP